MWAIPSQIAKLIWVLAVLTMTVGNVLGLLQLNVKRVLAYSSIAHSGYMLVGVAALVMRKQPDSAEQMNIQQEALQGVLFYLAAYGIMNAAAFGVLMLLPSRDNKPATSAETFEDLAGTGRKHVGLGLGDGGRVLQPDWIAADGRILRQVLSHLAGAAWSRIIGWSC